MKTLFHILFAVLLCTLACAVSAKEAGIRFHVTISRSGSLLIDQAADVGLGQVATLAKTTNFAMPGAACAVTGGARTSVAGTGKSGVTVTVQPVSESGDAASVRAIVHLENSQFVQPVPIQAGACKGETPAMLKYDSSATFNLRKLHDGKLHVGSYTVTVTLIDATPVLRHGLSI